MRTAAIRQELLNSTDEDLQRGRKVVALSAAGLCDFAFISLYQSGVIKRLPDYLLSLLTQIKLTQQ